MAYPVDINRSVVLGVDKTVYVPSDSHWILLGWHFDSWFGFGGGQAEVGYKGKVAIISKTSKTISSLDINRCRYKMGFWGWWTKTKELPDPPFLITNRLNTKLIFDGEVELELNEEGKEIFFGEIDPDLIGVPISFLVLGSSGWFGEITKTDTSETDTSDSFHLLVYSDLVEQESILNSEIIANSDVAMAMDELIKGEEIDVEQFKPFGRVTRLLSKSEMSLSRQ
jgi:hypothetical protein